MSDETKKTILIVDDTKPIRIMMLKKLEKHYRCLLASDPAEAIKIFNDYREDIDLIISDYEMPGMTGYDFLKKIKAVHFNIPVIMVSGALNKVRITELIKLGVRKFMAKPVNMNRLLSEINEIAGEDEIPEL